MDQKYHDTVQTGFDGGTSLFECPSCSYRAMLDHERGALTIIEPSDAEVHILHAGRVNTIQRFDVDIEEEK